MSISIPTELRVLLHLSILVFIGCSQDDNRQPTPLHVKPTTISPTPPRVMFAQHLRDTMVTDTAWLRDALSRHFRMSVGVGVDLPVNLDDDPEREHIVVLDRYRDTVVADTAAFFTEESRLVVIDSIGNEGSVIFDEKVFIVSQEVWPELGVFDATVSRPAFYVATFRERGGQGYSYYYRVFRYADGEIHEAAEMVRSLAFHICVCDVKPTVEAEITQDRSGDLITTIDYSFIANSCIHDTIMGGRCEDLFDADDNLIDETATIRYRWDSVKYEYKPQFAGTKLTEEKMRHVENVCPDEPFGRAFRDELQRIIRRESPCKRAMARLLLDVVGED